MRALMIFPIQRIILAGIILLASLPVQSMPNASPVTPRCESLFGETPKIPVPGARTNISQTEFAGSKTENGWQIVASSKKANKNALSRIDTDNNPESYPEDFLANRDRTVIVKAGLNDEVITVTRSGGPSLRFRKPGHRFYSTALSKNGDLIAIGYDRRDLVEIYSLVPKVDDPFGAVGKLVGSFQTSNSRDGKKEIRHLVFSDDANLVVAISYHGQGAIFNRTENSIIPFHLRANSNGVAFSRDQRQIHIGTRQHTVITISALTGRTLHTVRDLQGFNQEARGKISALQNGYILARAPDATYLLKDGRLVTELPNNANEEALSVDEAGGMVFMINKGPGGLRPIVYQIENGRIQPIRKLEFDEAHSRHISQSMVNRKFGIAAAGITYEVAVPNDPRYASMRAAGYEIVNEQRLDRDSRGQVFVWDLPTGRILAKLTSRQGPHIDRSSVTGLFFNEETGELVVAHSNGISYMFNLTNIRKSLPYEKDDETSRLETNR